MKQKTLILIVAFVGLCFNSFAQVVGQDADGFSTIILPSSNLYLQADDPKASFSFYKETWKGKKPFNDLRSEQEEVFNYIFNEYKNIFTIDLKNKSKESKKILMEIRTLLKDSVWEYNSGKFNESDRAKYFILGGEVTGGISNGLSTLFSGGEFSTSNALTGFIGHNWYTYKYKDDDKLINNYIIARIGLEKANLDLAKNQKKITAELHKLLRFGILTEGEKNYYSNYTNEDYETSINGLHQFIKDIKVIQGQGVGDVKALISNLEKIKTKAKTNQDIAATIVTREQLRKAEKALKDAEEKIKDPKNPTTEEKNNVASKQKKKDEIEKKLLSNTNLIDKGKVERNTTQIIQLLQSIPMVNDLLIEEISEKIDNEYYNASKWVEVITLLNKKLDAYEYSLDTTKASNFDGLIDAYSKRIDLLQKAIQQNKSYKKYINDIKYFTRTILYVRGGYKGASFKLDQMNEATTIAERISNNNFNGYTLQLGITHQFKIYNYFGLSASISRDNNIGALSSNTFKFTKEDTSLANGTITSSEEITALTGTYDRFLRFSFSADYVHLFSLKESLNPTDNTQKSHLYLSLNPYIRHHEYNRTETIKKNTVVGLGLHAFDSKDNRLMGGVFVQSNDTFGANTATPNAVGNRITFGLIAKFGFTGLKPKASN